VSASSDKKTYVAQYGDEKKETLAAALEAAAADNDNSNGTKTVKLLANAEAAITVADGKVLSLDLNGFTLTNKGKDGDTITVEQGGKLFVSGTGIVQSEVNGKAALTNSGEVTIYAGSFTRSDDNAIVVVNDGTMTINDGNFFYPTSVEAPTHAVIYNNGTDLIINGGSFTGGKDTVWNGATGTLTINAGTFINEYSEGFAVRNYNTATINGGSFTGMVGVPTLKEDATTGKNVTLTITSGKNGVMSTFINDNNCVFRAGLGTINVSCGSASSKGHFIAYATGTGVINITNGTFNSSALFYAPGYATSDNSEADGTIKVTGGTYMVNVSEAKDTDHNIAYSSYLETGYKTIGLGANSYKVVTNDYAEKTKAAQIGLGNYYETLQAALSAAKGGQIVTLLTDVEENITFPQAQPQAASEGADANLAVTLDLNGHTITNTGDSNTLTNTGKLVILDSSTEKTGEIINTQSGKSAVVNSTNGILSLSGGKVTNKTSDTTGYAVSNSGTSLVIDGAVVTGKLNPADDSKISIHSGSFTVDPTTYKATDSVIITASDPAPTTWTVVGANKVKVAATKETAENTLTYGDSTTVALTASVTFTGESLDKLVTWSSSDEAVATVNETGVVTATGAGTATIIATVNGTNDTAQGRYQVTVAKAEPTVTLTASSTTLYGDGTVTLTVDAPAEGASAVTVTGGVTPTKNSDGTWSVSLPNTTASYTFTATYPASDNYLAGTAACTVSVNYYDYSESVTTTTGSTTAGGSTTTTGADGSTTTTATTTTTDRTTGAVTETTTSTTTAADGAKTESTVATTTAKDGTVTETATEKTTAADGAVTESEVKTVTATDGTVTETATSKTTAADGATTESKTETVTAADGAKTETVTATAVAADGSTTQTNKKTVTTAEGVTTSTETVKAATADGTTASKVTTVDETGASVTVAEASISAQAVAAAAESGAAVTLPVTVAATKADSDEAAPVVALSIPEDVDSVTVEIPVENVTAGTVVVLVHADGTEEIVKVSTVTDAGVALNISGDVTVKLVDNTKDFDDVADSWAGDAITFATSHELFNGQGDGVFAPEGDMTRSMLVTVLARLDGVDTTTGSTWDEAGLNWAKENGISDGTNGDSSITREQLATMLYRYVGTPAVDSAAAQNFPDAGQVNSYAADAMNWAVSAGIIGGTGDGTLNPSGSASRAEVATMLQRFTGVLVK
jgi:hypothetical protein